MNQPRPEPSQLSSHIRRASGARGQVATEFMLYTAVFMFVAVAAFIVVSDLQNTEIPLQQNTLAKETGQGFISILTLSVKGGTGFSYRYTFPKNLYNLPYVIDMNQIDSPNATILLTWEGSYGNFSYEYGLPHYNYSISGPCLSGGILTSNNCSNVLLLNNDGENLTITQLP